ncbi:hypothetical protein [Desulfofalx alkaliphila]|uniref:hypothetical protein n=1 Tax=Desulfofalx alkaliphila TaxID=105483 RepID=UPI0004E14622|nr:hypothetical protein [Desulfofalx alkaliphila]
MLLLRDILSKANEFRTLAMSLFDEFNPVLSRGGIMHIIETDPHKIIEAAKEGKIPFTGQNGALTILRLKKRLLDMQSYFYDFSEYLEPVDLLPYLEQNEYRYVMTKARENNDDLVSACKIGNIMFVTVIREIVPNDTRWNLALYRIKEKWRKQNIKRVV